MTMLKRAKALRDFQEDASTTIFLLSMRAGAVGINLTQANRVFILEPAMNPALEAQAIGRVHRLGQRKDVEVIKMYITESFETRLLSMLEKKYGSKSKEDDTKDVPNISVDMVLSSNSNISSPKVDNGTVGHVSRDHVTMAEEEFDILFGVNDT